MYQSLKVLHMSGFVGLVPIKNYQFSLSIEFIRNSIKLQNITSCNYLVKFLKRTNLNVVIDGANIGFQKGKKINFYTINYIYLILKKKIISQWLKIKPFLRNHIM